MVSNFIGVSEASSPSENLLLACFIRVWGASSLSENLLLACFHRDFNSFHVFDPGNVWPRIPHSIDETPSC